ncbi:MAG: hypothetical protein U9P70_03240 [Patescibacteria group bacterium]|nr:hypothetical protein [Patescibacteria group bacterium]
MDISDAKFNKKSISSEFLFLGVFLLVSCVIMYFFVKPLCEEVKFTMLEISLKEKNIESKELLFLGISNINNDEDINENIEKINNLIPSKNNYENYLAHIVKLASAKNIVVSNFSIRGGRSEVRTKDKKLSEAEITFSSSGGFLNFISFLRDVENGIPFVQVESISISGDAKENNDDEEVDLGLILNQQVNLKFYYY